MFVVVVIECHYAPLEGLVDIITVLLNYALFQELRSLNRGCAVQFLVALYFYNSCVVVLQKIIVVT